jgi:hypothetical protein
LLSAAVHDAVDGGRNENSRALAKPTTIASTTTPPTHTRKGVTAVYPRWDKFDLRREMATAVARSLSETLDGKTTTAIRASRTARREGGHCAALFLCGGRHVNLLKASGPSLASFDDVGPAMPPGSAAGTLHHRMTNRVLF